ncbi:MAG: DNA polymerase, partial [Actinomycetota bacterium]|nr:DNA polymerase [Actinomycetota bacterium]
MPTYKPGDHQIVAIVLKMIDRGMPVDVGLWNDTIEETERNAARLEQEALELAPEHPRGLGWKLHANYSPHTKPENRRDGKLALELKGYEARDMKVPTLTELAAQTGDEFVTRLMIYRQERNALNRLQKWPANHIHSGRIHARLNPYGTETGRITTAEPNLQGLDRKRPEWRKCIRAPEGKKILKADLNQIELRILAKVSGDEALKSIYTEGRDLHALTAERAVGHPVAKDSPERSIAKTVNFALAYGGTAWTIRDRLLKEGVIKPLEEIEQFVRGFFEAFPGVESWQERFGERDPDEEDAFVTHSLLGRRRIVGVVKSGYWKGYPKREERLNGPIQATGSDILKMILKRLSKEEEHHPHARLLLSAHDEVVLEVDEGYEDDAVSWVKGVMREAVEEVLGSELGGPG